MSPITSSTPRHNTFFSNIVSDLTVVANTCIRWEIQRVMTGMFNGTERPLVVADFLIEAQVLLMTAEECLNHLGLIRDDDDAIRCMLSTLFKLEQRAHALDINPVSSFCRTLRRLFRHAQASGVLSNDTVETLKQCLTLLAWQLELIDLDTGQLALDETEESLLVATLTQQIDPPCQLSHSTPEQ